MRLRSCLMMVSMSFCLSLSVFLNWAKTLFFLLVSLILEIRKDRWRYGGSERINKGESERNERKKKKKLENKQG